MSYSEHLEIIIMIERYNNIISILNNIWDNYVCMCGEMKSLSHSTLIKSLHCTYVHILHTNN